MIYNLICHHCGEPFQAKHKNKYCIKPECQEQIKINKIKCTKEWREKQKNTPKLELKPAPNILKLKYLVCRDCENRYRLADGERTGSCMAFDDGIMGIINTSWVKDNKCQAYLNIKDRYQLESKLRKGYGK